MIRLPVVPIVAVCMSLSVPASTREARASAFVRMDLEALSANAEAIFVGRVDEIVSHVVSPNADRIVTDVTLRCERDLLGAPDGSRFVIRHLGGEVGGMGQLVFGEARYSVGERVLVFAAKRQGSWYTLGMAQGALHVYVDENGAQRVRTHIAGARLLGHEGSGGPDGLTLDAVVDEVRSFVARKARK